MSNQRLKHHILLTLLQERLTRPRTSPAFRISVAIHPQLSSHHPEIPIPSLVHLASPGIVSTFHSRPVDTLFGNEVLLSAGVRHAGVKPRSLVYQVECLQPDAGIPIFPLHLTLATLVITLYCASSSATFLTLVPSGKGFEPIVTTAIAGSLQHKQLYRWRS
jgi:hypothetical protein